MSAIALLSNVTLAGPWLVPSLRRYTGCDVLVPPGFGTWRQALSNTEFISKADVSFLVLDGANLLGSDGLRDMALARARVDDALSALQNFLQTQPAPSLCVADLDIPPLVVRSAMSPDVASMAAYTWRTGLEALHLPVMDVANLADDMGRARFYSPTAWYNAALPYSMEGEKALAALMAQLWRALHGHRKKVLVLDLDNTLWGGVVSEDGIEGVQLGTDHIGAAYRDFQQLCKDLKEQGVLLAVISKNNREDALSCITEHPHMVLREHDFVEIIANWEDKPRNLANLAQRLNLGLDAFVFVDDNPVEREAMRHSLPQVTVPEFPATPTKLPAFALTLAAQFFCIIHTTEEDLHKTEDYQAEQHRRKAQAAMTDVSAWLRSLHMELTVSLLSPKYIPRAAQLTQKTNQFSLTARRYTEAELQRMATESQWRMFLGRLRDSYGDMGMIALCLAQVNGSDAEMDVFLMSCRAMGRTVETAFLTAVEERLYREGVRRVVASYVPTTKNSVVKDFWSRERYTPLLNREGFFSKSLPADFHSCHYVHIVCEEKEVQDSTNTNKLTMK